MAAAKPSSVLLRDKQVLITAGPTREYWDPVRFLSNASSGTMGIALAREACRRGARVTLILGPIPGPAPRSRGRLRVVLVVSAQDMDAAVQERLPGTQIFIGAAAVADYRPAALARQKLKDRSPALTLTLCRNPDIIARVARRGPRRPDVVIGFALETQNLLANAREKLRGKGLDWIVANPGSNIGSPRGVAHLISRWGEDIPLGRRPKPALARRLWEALLSRPAL